jgi:hypothetical protein
MVLWLTAVVVVEPHMAVAVEEVHWFWSGLEEQVHSFWPGLDLVLLERIWAQAEVHDLMVWLLRKEMSE